MCCNENVPHPYAVATPLYKIHLARSHIDAMVPCQSCNTSNYLVSWVQLLGASICCRFDLYFVAQHVTSVQAPRSDSCQ